MEWHEHDNVTQIRDVKMNQSPSASGYRGESIYCFSAHDDVAEVYDIPLNRPSHVHSFRRRVVKQRDDWLKIYQGNMCTTLRPILFLIRQENETRAACRSVGPSNDDHHKICFPSGCFRGSKIEKQNENIRRRSIPCYYLSMQRVGIGCRCPL